MVWTSRFRFAGTRLLLTLFAISCLLTAGEVSAAQLIASWVDNSDGVAFTRIERRLDVETVFATIADIPPGVTEYVDASVNTGTTYCYRALAYDSEGVSPYSDEACATAGDDRAAMNVIVTKTGNGSGAVVSTPAGIDCGSACSATYFDSAYVITLVATPDSGSVFEGWSGGGCAGTASCILAGNVPVAVTASFATTTEMAPPPSLPSWPTALAADGAVDGTTGMAPPPPLPSWPATLGVTYNGKLRDRVGQGSTALAADGMLDGALTVTLSASGGRTVTGLTLQSTGPGNWDTDPGSGSWALGVATAFDDLSLINDPWTKAVNFAVPDGGTFVLFASDSAGIEFLPGATLMLTATFSDGTTATATTMVEGLSVTYNGKLRDRVGQSSIALAADGALDAALSVTLSASGGRTVTGVTLRSTGPGNWDTDASSGYWALGVATALDDLPLINDPWTKAVNFTVPDGGTFVLFAADSMGIEFVPGTLLTVTATFSDGTAVTATTMVEGS